MVEMSGRARGRIWPVKAKCSASFGGDNMKLLGRGLLTVFVLVVVLTFGGALSLGASPNGSLDATLGFAPKDAVLCVGVDLEGIGQDAGPLREIPGLILEAVGKASGKDLPGELESSAGLSFREEIAPALPKQFALMITGQGAKGIVLVARPGDLEVAKRLAARFRENAQKADRPVSEEEYSGTVIISATGKAMGGAYAFKDGHVVLGASVESVKTALDAHGSPQGSLLASQGFRDLRGQLKGDADMLCYVDAAGYMKWWGETFGALAAGLGPGADSAAASDFGKMFGPGGGLGDWAAMLKGTVSLVAVDFTSQGLEMESVGQPGEQLRSLVAGMGRLAPVDRGLLERMPANPIALAAETSPAQVWAAVKQLYASMPPIGMMLDLARKGLAKVGLDLDRDVIGWMKGTTAAGVYYDVKPFPNVLIAWDVQDVGEVRGALKRIEEAVTRATSGEVRFVEEQKDGGTVIRIEAEGLKNVPFFRPALVLTEKTLYLSSLESALDRALSGGRGTAAESVVELPREAHFLGMIDFRQLSGLVSDLALFAEAGASGEGAAGPGFVLKKLAEGLNCFGKATGFSQIRGDSSSIERYSLPIDYEALVNLAKELIARIQPVRTHVPVPQASVGQVETKGPLYAKVALTPDGSKVLSVRFDKSAETVDGRDVLYADVDFDGEFEAGEMFRAAEGGPSGTDGEIFRPFPPIRLTIPWGGAEGTEATWDITFLYARYPTALLFRGGGTQTAEQFRLGAQLSLRQGPNQWSYLLNGDVEPAVRLEDATLQGLAGAPGLQITTKPDLEQKGNLGIALSLVTGETEIRCTSGAGSSEAHVVIKDAAGRIVHEDRAPADKFAFG